EVDQLLADADEVERDLPPAPPPSGNFKAPTLPEPGSKLRQTPSGRFQTESGRYQSPSGKFPAPTPPATRKPAAPPPPVDDLEVELELGAAVEQAVTAPPPVDEDFYDDIVVEAAREQPTDKPPAPKPILAPPAPPPPSARPTPVDDDEDLFEVTVDATEARASDPDRTPLPIAEG